MNGHKAKILRKNIRKISNELVIQFFKEVTNESFFLRFKFALKILFPKIFNKRELKK